VVMKNRKQALEDFYNEVARVINNQEGVEGIVIAGPGFTKNDFFQFLSHSFPEKAKMSRIENTGTGGRVGIREVIKKGILDEMATEGRIVHEMRAMNRVLEEIGKSSSLVTYGKNDVKNAAQAGAVEELMVIDNLVRKEDVEKIMNLVENLRGKVMVVSSEHEGGKQLTALGGMAALLRYPLS